MMAAACDSILCVGEIVWDLLPDGPRLGGAPVNAAVHLARTGVRTRLLTAVGNDELGRRASAFLETEGLSGASVHPALPTGTVGVALDSAGVPCFTIEGRAAWTELRAGNLPTEGPAVLLFGGLAMHSPSNRRTLRGLFESLRPGLRLCDLNLRPGWSDPKVAAWCIGQAEVLKVNEEEWRFLAGIEGLPEDGPRTFLARHRLQGLCITLGARGLRWFDPTGNDLTLPARAAPVAIVDTVGAGDAVTAAIVLGLLRRESPAVFLDRAAAWAAQVCCIAGAF